MTRGEKTWVVRAGDGSTVGDIVRRAREDDSAIADGRVFVGRQRVTRADAPVRSGDVVRIAAAERAPDVPILWRESDLVAVDKPAGIPTVPDHRGASHALVTIVARAVGRPITDVRVTSRLDKEVSGVVVFALGDDAERRLRAARERGTYARRYVALASSGGGARALTSTGAWTAAIGRARDPLLRKANGPDAKPATTRWRAIARAAGGRVALLAIDPVTGRTHQIRVHASHAGLALLGDPDYGGATSFVQDDGRVVAIARVALHAARVVVPAKDGSPLVARAPVPADLAQVWTALGGAPEAWDTALSCET